MNLFRSISFNFVQLLIFSCLLFSYGCSSENVSEEVIQKDAQSKRAELNKLPTNHQLKQEYSKFSFEEKRAIWVDKISQVKTRNISKKHNLYFSELVTLLKNTERPTEIHRAEIEEVALKILKITPREDFIQIFMSTRDYTDNFEVSQYQICEECIDKLKKEFLLGRQRYTAKTKNPSLQKIEADCDCEWTCGWSGDTTDDCEPTDSGCGFMWWYPCEHTDAITPG